MTSIYFMKESNLDALEQRFQTFAKGRTIINAQLTICDNAKDKYILTVLYKI